MMVEWGHQFNNFLAIEFLGWFSVAVSRSAPIRSPSINNSPSLLYAEWTTWHKRISNFGPVYWSRTNAEAFGLHLTLRKKDYKNLTWATSNIISKSLFGGRQLFPAFFSSALQRSTQGINANSEVPLASKTNLSYLWHQRRTSHHHCPPGLHQWK
jgi:hypothetical protein